MYIHKGSGGKGMGWEGVWKISRCPLAEDVILTLYTSSKRMRIPIDNLNNIDSNLAHFRPHNAGANWAGIILSGVSMR